MVPGPVVVEGVERPYAVVLRGGYPSKDLYQVSGDGLTYLTLSSKQLDTALQAPVGAPLAPQVTPATDHGQTPVASNLTPLGVRAILTGRDLLSALPPASGCARAPGWRAPRWLGLLRPEQGPSVLWQAVDSTGRLHATEWEMDGSVRYLTSTDGGRTVRSSQVPLPEGFGAPRRDAVDLKAHAGAGVVAIGVHAQNAVTGQSQDIVAEYRYTTDGPVFTALHRVGKGDLASGAGVSSTAPRFDFATAGDPAGRPHRDLLQRRRPHEPRRRGPGDPDAQATRRGTAQLPDAPVPNGPGAGPRHPLAGRRRPATCPPGVLLLDHDLLEDGRQRERQRVGGGQVVLHRHDDDGAVRRARRDRSPRGPTSPAG